MPTCQVPTATWVPTIPLISHLVFDPRPRSTTLDRKGDPVWNFWHSLKCWKHFKECRTSSNDGNCRKTPADRRGDAFALFELLSFDRPRADPSPRTRHSVSLSVSPCRLLWCGCLSVSMFVRPSCALDLKSINNQATRIGTFGAHYLRPTP